MSFISIASRSFAILALSCVVSSYVHADNYQVSSDSDITGDINFNDVLTTDLFQNQGLLFVSDLNENPTPGVALGYVSNASLALGSSDVFILDHITDQKITLMIRVDDNIQAKIDVPIILSTMDEEIHFNLGADSQLQISGAISGNGILRKTDLGSLLMDNLSAFTGQLIVEEGAASLSIPGALNAVVQISSGASFTAAVVDVGSPLIDNEGSLILFSPASFTEVSGIIQGQGSFEKTGTGTLSLSGSNSYAGGTTVTTGRLILTSDSAQGPIINNAELEFNTDRGTLYSDLLSGSGAFYKTGLADLTIFSDLSAATGDFYVDAGSLTLNDDAFVQNNFTLDSNTTLHLNLALTHAYGGQVLGSGAIVKSGVGALSFSDTIGYDLLTISEGSVSLNEDSLSGNITNDATVNISIASEIYDYQNVFLSSGTLNKLGEGTLLFSNTLTQSGLTNINAGALEVRDLFHIEDVAMSSSGSLIFNIEDRNEYAHTMSGTGSVVKQGAGELVFYSPQTYTLGTTVSEGSLTVYDEAFQGDYTLTGDLNVVLDQSDVAWTSVIEGTGSLRKRGFYDLTLSQVQSYTGETVIQEGDLYIGIDNALSDRSEVVLYPLTTLHLQGYDLAIGGLSQSGKVVLGGGTLSLGGHDGDTVFSGVIEGDTGAIIKTGLGNWTVNTQQSYLGLTTVANGTITQGIAQFLPATNSLQLDSTGTLDLSGYDLSLSALTGTGSVLLSNGALTLDIAETNLFSGVISGDTGTIIKTGAGNWTVNAQQSYLGLTTIEEGTITQGISQFLPTTNSLQLNATGTLDLGGYDLSLSALTGTGSVLLSNGALTLDIAETNVFSGVISQAGIVHKTGIGTLNLSALQTYIGPTFLDEGTLLVSVSQALPATTKLTVASGTIFSLEAETQTIASLFGSGTVSLNDYALIIDGLDETIFSGAITGSNVSSMVLQNGAAATLSGTLPMSGSIAVDATSTLLLESILPAGSLSVDGVLTLNTALADMEMDISVGGSGDFVKTGSYALDFSRDFTYTGLTSLTDGALHIYNVELATSNIENNSALYFYGNATSDWTIPYSISGTGAVYYNPLADQTFILQGDVSYLGNTTLSAGTLIHDGISITVNGGALSVAELAVYKSVDSTIHMTGSSSQSAGLWYMDNSIIDSTGASETVTFTSVGNDSYQTGLWIEDAGLTLSASDQDLMLNANIYGSGGLIKTGSQDAYLSPIEEVNYSGTTQIQAGSLAVNQLFNTTSDIAISSGAALHIYVTDSSTKEMVSDLSGAGGVTCNVGSILLTGDVGYTGLTDITEAAQLGLSTNFSGTGLINNDGIFDITVPSGETYRMDNIFQGAGTVNKYGDGILILGGAFDNLVGTFKVYDGDLTFTTVPTSSLDITGRFSVITTTDAVLGLTSGGSSAYFGGTITGIQDTRFQLLGYKDDTTMTIQKFSLTGTLDLAQKKQNDSSADLGSGPQFEFVDFEVFDGCAMNFQFDQSDDAGTMRSFLQYDTASLPTLANITYSLQSLNVSTAAFSNRSYRLLTVLTAEEADVVKISEMAANIQYPVVFTVSPLVTLDEETAILTFDVSITKKDAGEILALNQITIPSSIVYLARQLSQNDNSAYVLDYSNSLEDFLDHIQNYKPTGTQAKISASSAPPSSVQAAQSSTYASSMQLLGMHLSNQQGGRYKAPFHSPENNKNIARPALFNALNQKAIQHVEPDHDVNWSKLLDGLSLAGISLSVESNYVHQRIKSQDLDPDFLINSWGTTLGASKVVDQKYILGVLASSAGRRQNLAPNIQNKTAVTHERTQSLGMFTAYQDPNQPYYVSGFLSFGKHDYKITRTWLHPVYDPLEHQNILIPSEASSRHKGYDLTGNCEIGYTYIVSQFTALQPFIGAGTTRLSSPSYEESAIRTDTGDETFYGNIVSQEILKKNSRSIGIQGIHSLVSDDAAYQVSTRMTYVTEKIPGEQSIFQYAYQNDPSVKIDILTDNLREGAFEMSVGFNAAYANQWIISTNYIGHFGCALTSHTVVATAQYSFY